MLVYFGAVERVTSGLTVTNVVEPLRVAAAECQTDEPDVITSGVEQVLQPRPAGLGETIYQFLAHMIDMKRSNLVDQLVAKNIFSPAEKQGIKRQKKAEAKVDSLLRAMRTKSAAEFDSFLVTLSEVGQQSVADVVRQALHTLGQTGYNPLIHAYGTVWFS